MAKAFSLISVAVSIEPLSCSSLKMAKKLPGDQAGRFGARRLG
jgi:hypothetical protein